ncbi:MAG: tRNA (adenosine(37)-N6)-threonylcarbamoyltransferase complex ATPase subunit type 1 TsaE [Chloroflexi bacterium]|nr:tRNA (adenosine(37)-N6)-threonylcarbamoyltransferase complex ATPase subunit type 1 TsaE [Chloroflexota bacterium]
MSAKAPKMIHIHSDSPKRSEQLGAALGKLLGAGDLICLSGQLGAGKTLLSRGIGLGWGADPPLSSPTFNLVHEHRRNCDEMRLLHIDLYRISGPADAASLGIDDIVDSDDIVIIEWSERLSGYLPADRLRIDIELGGAQERELIVCARGQRHLRLLDAWREATLAGT